MLEYYKMIRKKIPKRGQEISKMGEALLEKKYEYWKNQLLDLGKRNKMISYRETKRTTLQLLEPEFEKLFHLIAVEEEELTFQRPIDRNSDIRTYSVLSLLENLSCPIPVSIGDIKAEGSLVERQKTLRQLRSRSRLALDEQGTNILYLVFGFIEWREKNNANSTWVKSPLILVPVSLIVESLNAPYVLKKYEDDIVINPTLSYLFERDYGITLPRFESDEQDISDYMDIMEKLVDKRGWKILRESNIGLVSFLKINMYKDLLNNEENVKRNPIIRAFAGTKNAIAENRENYYDSDHDAIASVDNYQVVNADSSQQDAILLSQKGVSFVMQGPPGTGKSQTITNIIAQGLAEGKRILFVSEKVAALEVVYKRLAEVHLDDFCLALHSYRANKKEILDELGESLELKRIKVKEEELARLTELDMLKELLKKYVKDIHAEIMPLEMSLYEVYGAVSSLIDYHDISFEIEGVEEMSKDQVNRLGLLVSNFDKAKNKLGEEWYKNPWNGTVIVNVNYNLIEQIKERFSRIIFCLSQLADDISEIEQFDKDNIISVRVDKIDIFLHMLSLLQGCQNIPRNWLFENILGDIKRSAETYSQRSQQMNDNKKIIADKFDKQFMLIQATEKIERCTSLRVSISKSIRIEQTTWDKVFSRLSDDYKEINTLYIDLDNMIREVNSISEILEVEFDDSVESIKRYYRLCSLLNRKPKILTQWFENDDTEDLIIKIKIYKEIIEKRKLRADEIASEYSLDLLSQDVNEFLGLLDELSLDNNYAVISNLDHAKFQEYVTKRNQEYSEVKKTWGDLGRNHTLLMIETGIKYPQRLEEIDNYVCLLKTLIRDIRPTDSWLGSETVDEFELLIDECKNYLEKYSVIRNTLREKWEDSVLNIDYEGMLNRFKTEYIGIFKILKKSYRNDIKVLRGAFREVGKKITDKEAVEVLLKLKEMHEVEEWFARNKSKHQEMFGSKYNGIKSEWDTISNDIKYYKQCYELPGVGAKLPVILQKYESSSKAKLMLEIESWNELKLNMGNVKFETIYCLTKIEAALELFEDLLQKLRKAETVFEFIQTYEIRQHNLNIVEIHGLMNKVADDRKSIIEENDLEKELQNILGESFLFEDTNLENIESAVSTWHEIKSLLLVVPEKVKETLIQKSYNISLKYSEENVQGVLGKLGKRLCCDTIFLESYIDLRKNLETLLYQYEELQSEYKAMALYQIEDISPEEVFGSLIKLESIQKYEDELLEDSAELKSRFGKYFAGTDTDWDKLIEEINRVIELKKCIETMNLSDKQKVALVYSDTNNINLAIMKMHTKKVIENADDVNWICDLFEDAANFKKQSVRRTLHRWMECLEQLATLDSWIDFRECKKRCFNNGLENFIISAEDSTYKSGTLIHSFMKMFYLKWIEKTCAKTNEVALFRTRVQSSRIARFCELDDHQLPVAQMRIREKLIAELPNKYNFNRATDEMSVLLRELGKKRKIMPLRKLFRIIPNLLLKLKPCLMMSPLSVSYFLEAETYKFDMVVFDEASQIFPQDAIGAICRGSQVIIAGDSKQLPPTNFFTSSTSNNDGDYDIDEDEDDVVYDSILEEATNSLPNKSLLWHYRSRNEDLIAFSNQEIYKNKLTTFPSSSTTTSDSGVEYAYVENGVYSGRCNVKEAQKCVELMKEHILKHPKRSLGIIAFSEKQQSAIEEEVQRFREENQHFESFFKEDKEEPFFIKNLENVQGDERDTILFSICYGKDANGRMYMRFGPLGQQGGERRLNVAITRAKYNVKLIGSILPYDIDLDKTKSDGVRMLRSYIEFAMKGSEILHQFKKKNDLYDNDEFCVCISKFLADQGYCIKQNVGNSDYKIDIAVEHPEYRGCYVAGIECDGNSYYKARTVRDREHLRTTILQQMSWKMYRVWSTEWINNFESEKKRLLDFLNEAMVSYRKPDEQKLLGIVKEVIVKTEEVQDVQSAINKSLYHFEYYEKGNWSKTLQDPRLGNLENLAASIREVVKVEQPLHMDLLYRRLAGAFGNEKVTKPVRDTIDAAISSVMANETVVEDEFIRFKTFTEIKARVPYLGDQERTIDYISKPEIADAMIIVIRNSYGIEPRALCTEASRIFGFDRMGLKISKAMNAVIDYMIKKKMIHIIDGKIQMTEV